MRRRTNQRIGGVLFMAFASFALFSTWKEWSGSSHRSFQPATGTVVRHTVALDNVLWLGRETTPVRLDSTVVFEGREIHVRDTFESGEDAWSAALARPPETQHTAPGERYTFFAAPDGRSYVWRRLPEFQLGLFLLGGVFFCIGLSMWFPKRSKFAVDRVLPVVVATAFIFTGCRAVIDSVVPTLRSFRATNWPTVKYEAIGSQRIKSGKSGIEATAFRYTYLGQKYETVVREPPAPDGVCRVDPERPWIAVLSTNYLVRAAGILPGFLFMAGGIGVGVILYRKRK